MAEPVDVYSDLVAIHLGPFGCTLNFSVSSPCRAAGGGTPGQLVATVRMSLEHLKLMTFKPKNWVCDPRLTRTGTVVLLTSEVNGAISRAEAVPWHHCASSALC